MGQVRSPLGVVLLSPEGIVRFVHEHAVLEEHDIHEPPEEEEHRQHKEELPVCPRKGSDEARDHEQIEEGSLRLCVKHVFVACFDIEFY